MSAPGQPERMRTIGMLGGMSWESTALYYRIANEQVRQERGGLSSASLLVRSVDFAGVRELQLEHRWDEAGQLLLREGKALEAGGADLVRLCTNYMHKVAPVLEAGLSVPFLHIADVVADAAPGATVGLLGAGGTVREPFYRERLERRGLQVLVPDEDDIAFVDQAIFGELCRGTLSEATRTRLGEVTARLADRGAQSVVLGCTELELLLRPQDSPVPLLPTARLHALAAVRLALSADRPLTG